VNEARPNSSRPCHAGRRRGARPVAAVAATIPMLAAYDPAVLNTAMTRVEARPSLRRSEATPPSTPTTTLPHGHDGPTTLYARMTGSEPFMPTTVTSSSTPTAWSWMGGRCCPLRSERSPELFEQVVWYSPYPEECARIPNCRGDAQIREAAKRVRANRNGSLRLIIRYDLTEEYV
jgi:hypothetical protein